MADKAKWLYRCGYCSRRSLHDSAAISADTVLWRVAFLNAPCESRSRCWSGCRRSGIVTQRRRLCLLWSVSRSRMLRTTWPKNPWIPFSKAIRITTSRELSFFGPLYLLTYREGDFQPSHEVSKHSKYHKMCLSISVYVSSTFTVFQERSSSEIIYSVLLDIEAQVAFPGKRMLERRFYYVP